MAARTNIDVEQVFLGEDVVTAIYLGDQLVWSFGITDMDILYVPTGFEEA